MTVRARYLPKLLPISIAQCHASFALHCIGSQQDLFYRHHVAEFPDDLTILDRVQAR